MPERVGVIGVGNMGGAMAARLLERGFEVVVRDIRSEAEQPLLALGARRAASPKEIAQSCTAVLIVVVNAGQIDEVFSGDDGLLAGLQPEKHLVLLQSTIAPADTVRLAASVSARGALVLDAPISGGPVRARAGQISMMVAGSDAAYSHARPLFETLATRVFRVGTEAGLGATMKLVNNLLAGVYLAAGAEAFAIGRAAGLDAQTMADVFAASSGQSWILTDRLTRLLAEETKPSAQLHILAKDLRLAVALGQTVDRFPQLGAAAREAFDAAIEAGFADEDDSALIRWRLNRSV
jgi:putative dehydrogenase